MRLTSSRGRSLLTASQGFGDRLLNEVKKLALKDVKIKIYAPPERKYSTWIGGSILAGLNTFKKVRLSCTRFDTYLTTRVDVGISRGVPGGSRHHSQETGFLSVRCPYSLSYHWFVGRSIYCLSYDTRHVVCTPNAISQVLVHARPRVSVGRTDIITKQVRLSPITPNERSAYT